MILIIRVILVKVMNIIYEINCILAEAKVLLAY